MKPTVFINYRREDAASEAARIRDAIETRLGKASAFMDVRDIKPGAVWPKEIIDALNHATVVIAVIGTKWLAVKNEHERRRIDLPEDWVRQELETAIVSEKKLIPIYVQGASPLSKVALLECIQAICDCQKVSIREESWESDIQLLLDALPSQRPEKEPSLAVTATHSQEELKLRKRFLDQIEKDISERLESSVHVARFMDLGIVHDPSAVGTLWGYRNPSNKKEYPDLDTAFDEAKKRLLVLGQPGSGKTTALLYLARKLIAKARESEQEPMPFFVNLSKFNRLVRRSYEPGPKSDDYRFQDWLAEELAQVPGINLKVATKWIQTGQIAALLDGLDEFNDDHRPELATLINETFLRRFPEMVVVVASRSNDYGLLRETENSLKLGEAVELQPLTPQQIDQYLVKADANGLKDAVRVDPSLQELAKTPLTLSMLTLAYAGLPPEDMPTALSLTDSRERLFKEYVNRRLQREARRRVGKPMDDSRANDVSETCFRYSREQLHRWLGTLAVVLSQRMTTVFSVDRFYSLLMPDDPKAEKSQALRRWSVIFAKALMLVLCSLAIAFPVLPLSVTGMAWGVYILVVIGFAATFTGPDVKHSTFNLHTFGIPAFLVGVNVFSCALNARWESLSLIYSGAFATTVFFIIVNGGLWIANRGATEDPMRRTLIAMITLVVFGLAWWIVGWLRAKDSTSDFIFVALLAIAWTVVGSPSGNHSLILQAARCARDTYLIMSVIWFSNIIGPIGPIHVTLATSLLIVGVFSAWEASLLPLAVSVAVVAMAGFGFGLAGLETGILVMSVLWFGIYVIVEFTSQPEQGYLTRSSRNNWLTRSHGTIHGWLEIHLLSPSVWWFWSLMRCFPLRKQLFFSFCCDVHLLKSSTQGGIEFIHRLVRDYFALRQLLPRIRSLSGPERLDSIRAFGFQGEAAIDPLIEIADSGDDATCAAALEGLSHIPSPTVTRCFERFIDDRRVVVRIALVSCLFRLPDNERDRLLGKMTPLGDGCEALPFCAGTKYFGIREANEFVAKWGEPGLQRLLIRTSEKSFWQNYNIAEGILGILVKVNEARLYPILCEACWAFAIDSYNLQILVDGLTLLGGTDAAPVLIQLLTKYVDKNAKYILEGIAKYPHPEHAKSVLDWLAKKPDASCLPPAIEIIQKMGDDKCILELAKRWSKLRKRIANDDLIKMKATDEWLQQISFTRIVPAFRPEDRQ